MATPAPDHRSGLRRPTASPVSAAAAVLALALGFGAVSALLIVDKAVLLDALPYRDPSRLVLLSGTFEQDGEVQDWAISHLDFLDWRAESDAFERMSVFTRDEYALNLVEGRGAERMNGELVSHGYFELLGVEPAAGRFFIAEEDGEPFENPVVVLGHDVWQRRYGGEPEVVGRSLDLNGRPYRVVGVAPAGFRGLSDEADLWVPSAMPPGADFVEIRRLRWLSGVGRLKPGVTIERAQADLDRVTAGLERRYPDMNKGMGVRLDPLPDLWFGELRRGLLLLTAGAALVLLLACANAAGLLRGRATPGQGLLVAAAGAALGLALGAWAVRALAPGSGVELPGFLRLSLSPGVVAAVLALAALCGLGIGLAPSPGPARAAAGAGPARRGVRRLAAVGVACQVALALALVVAAGSRYGEYRAAVGQDLGFRPQGLLTMRVDLRGPKWVDDPPVIDLVRQYLERLPRVPGVDEVAVGGPSMPTDDWTGGYMTIEDHDNPDSPDGTYTAMMHVVSPDYFDVLGVPLLAGRRFTMEDTKSFGVVVSESLAELHWPGQDPLGKRLKFGVRGNPERPWLTVLGVVGDVRHEGLMAEARPAPDIYVPALQFQLRLPLRVNFLIRPEAGVSAASLAPALRREVQAISPDVPAYDVTTMEERLHEQTARGRFEVLIVTIFAGLALILAVIAVWVLWALFERAGRVPARSPSRSAPGGGILERDAQGGERWRRPDPGVM